MKKTYALIGAAGYIAPRHMQAVSETGGDLVAALDPNDSVGILDRYFPDAQFFTEFERFDRYIDKMRRKAGTAVDYISICSPNYLHDSHMRFAMRSGADAICEKPLVLNQWNIDGLIDIEQDTGQRVNTILQLRVHPAIIALRERIRAENSNTKYEVDLSYITSRGQWYLQSWKGTEEKSGGIATNIGVHFFDMLYFLFGGLQSIEVHMTSPVKASGYLEYAQARVRWFMSLDINDVPAPQREQGQRTYRSIMINGEEIEFSGGFTDLHTLSYQEILAGRGFPLEENRTAIWAVSTIRNSPIIQNPSDPHPFLTRGLG